MRIVSRREWGARHPNGTGLARTPARTLRLHHSVTPAENGPGIIRRIEDIGHQRFKRGISYTFLVTPDGTVYEGHGIDRVGTHTRGENTTGRGICCVGNYDTQSPSPTMLRAVADLIRHGIEKDWWTGLTGGHRDVPGAATACPGRHLYAAIPEIRRLAATPVAAPVPQEEDVQRALVRFGNSQAPHNVYYVVENTAVFVRDRAALAARQWALALAGLDSTVHDWPSTFIGSLHFPSHAPKAG